MATDICQSFASRLTVDLGAIRANYRSIAERAAPAGCGAVIKADAYGLGARRVARALHDEGCRSFFVAQLSEALEIAPVIRHDGTIFILNGLDPGCEALCAERRLVPVLNSRGQIEQWRRVAREMGVRLPAALQVDSGMSRLGLDAHDVAGLSEDPDFTREVELRLIMTHLACGDDPERPANVEQLRRFRAIRSLFPAVPASIANSDGTFLAPDFHLDLVRPGIALFGGKPRRAEGALRDVVRLDARIIQIRAIVGGTGVGYGLDYVAPSPRRLATLGVGYGDGWPRSLGGVGAAWLDGRRLPIVGRISMDSLVVDISSLPKAALGEGDFVELLGPSQTITDVAREAGTISYEILTRIGRRHQRVYVERRTTELEALGGAQ